MVADDVDVVAGAAAVGLVCDHHLRSDHGDRRASRAGGMMQGVPQRSRSARSRQDAAAWWRRACGRARARPPAPPPPRRHGRARSARARAAQCAGCDGVAREPPRTASPSPAPGEIDAFAVAADPAQRSMPPLSDNLSARCAGIRPSAASRPVRKAAVVPRPPWRRPLSARGVALWGASTALELATASR